MYKSDIVYKIRNVNERLEEILKDNSLYLASPKSFNDPFDASAPPIVDIDDESLKTWFINGIKAGKLPSERHEEIAEKMIEEGAYKTDESKQGYIAGRISELNKLGICSLSKSISNILSWSHYGESHMGVAIGFKIGNLQYDEYYLQEVSYSKEFPNIRLDDSNIKDVIKRKYDCWEYEEEIRIVKKRGAGETMYLPNYTIKEIVFGYKCPQDKVEKVLSWINTSKMTPDVYFMDHVPGKYELKAVKARTTTIQVLNPM